jgi:hypothetical protein
MTPSILDTLNSEDVQTNPYVWAAWRPFDDLSYQRLMNAYPSLKQVIQGRPAPQNSRFDLDAAPLLAMDDIDPVMKEFVAYHTSKDFWLDIVDLFGPYIRHQYPWLEDAVGKPLEEFVVGVRNGRRAEGEFVDVEMDAKPGYNTPVRKLSSVRGQHLDNPREIWAALIYCRLAEDDSMGGDFVIDATDVPFERWNWWGKMELHPEPFHQHAAVPYLRNIGATFVNSREAVHSVTERTPGRHPRRLMNFVAELSGRHKPLFNVPKRRHPAPKTATQNQGTT